MTWWHALIDAGAIPATYAPPPSGGSTRDEVEGGERADLVEGNELQTHPIPEPRIPHPVSFLNGMQRWSVVAYDGVAQIVNAYVAAAVCRRDDRGVLHATLERTRAFAIAPLDRVSPTLRPLLGRGGPDIDPAENARWGRPARSLDQAGAPGH